MQIAIRKDFMTTVKEVIPEKGSNILVRAVSLCVGQGDSTLFFIKDGSRYATMLVDINMHERYGMDVPAFLKDVLGDSKLDIFLNTHPHEDHLHGIEELDKKVGFDKVMMADYDPGNDANDYWKAFTKIVERMKKSDSGSVIEIDGSYSTQKLFDAKIHVLAPAKFVTDETNDLTKKKRRELIHENCVVIRIGDGATWVMQPGDADYKAFKNYIYGAHKDQMSADVLLASHHGSKYFFWDDKSEQEEAWTDHLEAINPSAVIISAPRREYSQHKHPDPEAVEIYEKQCGAQKVFHTGKDMCSFIVDIYGDGTIGGVKSDDGFLMSKYQIGKTGPFITPTKPCGDIKPRQFG